VIEAVRLRRIVNANYASRLAKRSREMAKIYSEMAASPYESGEARPPLSEQTMTEIKALNLDQMFVQAVTLRGAVDYTLCTFILRSIGALTELPRARRLGLVRLVLRHFEALLPVADAVASFLNSCVDMSSSKKRSTCRQIMNKLKRMDAAGASPFLAIWMLDALSRDPEWNHASLVANLFSTTKSEVVRRSCAVALYRIGNRAHALQVRDHFNQASPMLRTAILLATRKLSDDEREHWRRLMNLSSAVERAL